MNQLPYIDHILKLRADEPASAFAAAFEHHIHWGLFDPPTDSPTLEQFRTAADKLTQCCIGLAGIQKGARVLDVGCGVGGTVAAVLRQYPEVHCTGLNINPRQLEIARATVTASSPSTVKFVEGDACALPFPDASVDVVLAVECIFHFPNRKRFFQEARRVLTPRGRLVFSDFIPHGPTFPLLVLWGLLFERHRVQGYFGRPSEKPPLFSTYMGWARSVGFTLWAARDITPQTLPTYTFLEQALGNDGAAAASSGRNALRSLATVSRRGWLRYRVLAFDAVP